MRRMSTASWGRILVGIRRALGHPRAAPTLLALLTLRYAAWIGYQALRDRLYDFNLYYTAALGFRQGLDIYALGERGMWGAWRALAAQTGIRYIAPPYRYPPLTAQLVLPLTALGPYWAGLTWLVLSVLALLGGVWLLGRCRTAQPGDRTGLALAAGLACLWLPDLTTLHAGQVNGLLLLALCTGLYGLWQGRPWLAGLGLGAGTMLKLIPVALAGYLAWLGGRKGWRRVAWTALGAVIVTIVVLWATTPLMLGGGTLRSYLSHLGALGSAGEITPWAPNQSLGGLLARALAGWLPADTIYAIYLGAAGALAVATAVLCWPPYGDPGPDARIRMRLEFALIVTALQLVTPYAWYHQLVLLLIPLWVLVDEVLTGRAPAWWLTPLALGVALSDLHGLAWHRLPVDWRLGLSLPALTGLLLWLLLAMQIRWGAGRADLPGRGSPLARGNKGGLSP